MLRRIRQRLVRDLFGTITGVETEVPAVALSFDDGPDPQATPRLLEILARHGAHATFFMLGCNAQAYPGLVRRVAAAGHTVANHSWDHASFAYLGRAKRREQIRRCADALHPYGQRIFRPPYGNQTLASRFDALWLGYRVATWDLVAGDWLGEDAQQLVRRVEEKIAPGRLILFHDHLHDVLDIDFADREPTLRAVEQLLERFSADYQFVTLPQLLCLGRARKVDWRMQADPEFLGRLKRPAESAVSAVPQQTAGGGL